MLFVHFSRGILRILFFSNAIYFHFQKAFMSSTKKDGQSRAENAFIWTDVIML